MEETAKTIAAFLESGAGADHPANEPYADCSDLEIATIDGRVNLIALARLLTQEAE